VARRLNSYDLIETLADLMLLHGIPEHLRSDNGPEFVAERLRKWLWGEELRHYISSPAARGRTATVKASTAGCAMKCLNGEIFYSLKEAQVVIEQWRVQYNTVRPHSSLGYRLPAPVTMMPGAGLSRGAWGYGKRCAFPTSPHPRLRLRTIFQQSVTLSCSACPESQIGRSRSEGRPKHALGVQSRKLRFPQGQGHAGLYLALRAMRLAAFAGFERDFSFHQLIRCCSMSVSEFIRVPVASTTRKVEGRNDG